MSKVYAVVDYNGTQKHLEFKDRVSPPYLAYNGQDFEKHAPDLPQTRKAGFVYYKREDKKSMIKGDDIYNLYTVVVDPKAH